MRDYLELKPKWHQDSMRSWTRNDAQYLGGCRDGDEAQSGPEHPGPLSTLQLICQEGPVPLDRFIEACLMFQSNYSACSGFWDGHVQGSQRFDNAYAIMICQDVLAEACDLSLCPLSLYMIRRNWNCSCHRVAHC